MPDPNYVALDVSLATAVTPPTDPPAGLWGTDYPGMKIEYVDSRVLKSNAAGHFEFSLSSVPTGMTGAKVVDMAFKQKPDGAWTRVQQQGQTRPFWITRASNDNKGIGINDVPTTHGSNKVEEDYDVLLVIAYTDSGGNTKHTCCDPEIHNEEA